jgi:hypothetical protein
VFSMSAYDQPVWAKSDTPNSLAHIKCERPPCERTPPALKTRHSEQLIRSPPPRPGAGHGAARTLELHGVARRRCGMNRAPICAGVRPCESVACGSAPAPSSRLATLTCPWTAA